MAFRPTGVDERYDDAVSKANVGFNFGASSISVVEYNVLEPLHLFRNLLSIADGLVGPYRITFVPFGPKIFSAVSIIIGMIHFPNICVWRISLNELSAPRDVHPDGKVVGLTIIKSTA